MPKRVHDPLVFDCDEPIPASECYNCGKVTDRARGPTLPEKGDFAICIHCAAASIFEDDLQQRRPTPVELAEILNSPIARSMIKAVQTVAKNLPLDK